MAEESKASSSQTAKSGSKVFWNVRDAGGSFSKAEESRDKSGNTPSGYLRFDDLKGNYSRLEEKMLRSRRRRLAMKMRDLGWSDGKILGLLNKHPDSWPTMSDLGGSRKADPKEEAKAEKAREKAKRDKEKAANKKEREANKAKREKEKAARDKERAANKAKAAVEKARKLKEREAKKAESEAKKATREKAAAAKKATREKEAASRKAASEAKKATREKEAAAKKAKAAATKSREEKLKEQIAELKKKQTPGKKLTAAKQATPTPSRQAEKVTPKLKSASKAEFDKSIAKVSRTTLRRIIDKLEADPSPAAKERLKWAKARLQTLVNRGG